MDDRGKRQLSCKTLAIVFAFAGLVWIVYGFLSPRYILFPLIGLGNLGIAYVCKKQSA
jgi:hypothetical protein